MAKAEEDGEEKEWCRAQLHSIQRDWESDWNRYHSVVGAYVVGT
jgi:hypothetical protein